MDRGFGDEKANSVVKIIYENEQLTVGGRNFVDSHQPETDNERLEEQPTESVMNEQVEVPAPRMQPRIDVNPFARPERVAFPGAEIIINWSGPPSVAVFEFIEQYMALRKKLFESEQKNGTSQGSPSATDKN